MCLTDFMPGTSAVSKTYVYTIHTGIVSDVFRRKYVYDYDKPLDTDRMKKSSSVSSRRA